MATNYSFKSYVLNNHNDLIIQQRKSSLYDYSLTQLNNNGVLMPFLRRLSANSITSEQLINDCLKSGLGEVYLECVKINQASYKRTARLQNRVRSMLTSGECLFLTLTFNDETLNNTTEKQRRVSVVRYLKQFLTPYVANIDFGALNHREHYHALIQSSKINFESWRKFGNINCERVRIKNIANDEIKLSKYIAKLSNHAIKETTKRSALIYSR